MYTYLKQVLKKGKYLNFQKYFQVFPPLIRVDFVSMNQKFTKLQTYHLFHSTFQIYRGW